MMSLPGGALPASNELLTFSGKPGYLLDGCEKMPEISIVLPVYNVAQYLNACLDSIATQTFQDWEAILVDDGNTDFSGIICNSYSRKDHRFRVIHQENQGVSSARNAGIDAATAQLLAFVDPDDFVSENFFSCLVGDLSANGAECAVSSFCNVHENGKEGIHEIQNRIEQEAKCRFPHVMSSNEDVIDALCGNLFSCTSWGKIFTRDLWGNARFPTGIDLSEDMMTVPPVIVRAKAAVYSPKARYFYRQRKRSLLNGTVTRNRTIKYFQASGIMVDRLTEHCPERRQDFERLRFQYDIGCLVSFIKSGGGTPGKQSCLFRLKEFRRLTKGGTGGE